MSNNYKELFNHYISLTKEYTLTESLKNSTSQTIEVLEKITEPKASYSYQEDKWTIIQVLSHIIDTERIMSYRALRYARQDQTKLSGFDENHYAAHAGTESRSINSLLEEFKALRTSTILLFNSFTNEMLTYSDNETGIGLTVDKLGRMIAGHSMHHCNILTERYGV